MLLLSSLHNFSSHTISSFFPSHSPRHVYYDSLHPTNAFHSPRQVYYDSLHPNNKRQHVGPHSFDIPLPSAPARAPPRHLRLFGRVRRYDAPDTDVSPTSPRGLVTHAGRQRNRLCQTTERIPAWTTDKTTRQDHVTAADCGAVVLVRVGAEDVRGVETTRLPAVSVDHLDDPGLGVADGAVGTLLPPSPRKSGLHATSLRRQPADGIVDLVLQGLGHHTDADPHSLDRRATVPA